MKKIYLIRHSAPFIDIENYDDYKSIDWKEYNKNMILSVEGEENARKLCEIEELKSIDKVYSANSFRAIGTAKYISELNNLKIKLDDRINERELGVEKISELPNNYTKDSFNDKNLKIGFGESLNEVDSRFNNFMSEILDSENNNIALFIHGIIMLSFLQNNTDFELNDKFLKLRFNNKLVYDGEMKNPMIFKLTYDNGKLIDIENVKNI